uniref:ATP-dependent Clp protease proteolytic subunit n=2 Tax=Cyperaceae TaxID=4609 RepID=A0A6H0EXP4_9POAL|nr:ATP-dependent Clp protease proteolytic subunit [Hypolytrum nemorum]ANP26037.1 ATP-dependent Clp protease proteolytic subunit [Hypolytrum nemorum]QIB72615.1 ATP-dependent Clp protease proteolytic subunit [Cyperus glomeratus]QIB72708.1 ATP-dependent Clp protease proteolytic subunit [Cyperus difformis]QIT06800.1 ATP-dependent Clp protease proteolytic subunit [Cyperus fuscus]
MGIGIPRVPFRRPGTKKPTWLDIERLYRERALFLCKEIEGTIVGQIIALLLYLSSENDTNIFLYINSPGGWALSGMAIYDTMKNVLPDVCTLAMGLAASAASLILVGGTITKRVAFPHARVMIHQPFTAYFWGTAKIIVLEGEELFELRKAIANIYAQNTGKPVSVIQKDLERDNYMSATEAQAYGIVDRIAKLKEQN